VELVYENGRLVRGATRGDGVIGEEITEGLRIIRSIPLSLRQGEVALPTLLSVRGEVYMPKDGFQAMNRDRIESGEEPFANPRNAAAGTLRQLDPKIVAGRPMSIYVFDILAIDGLTFGAHSEVIEGLKSWGFRVNDRVEVCPAVEDAILYHERLREERDSLPYEIDGVVIKIDDLDARTTLGEKGRSPRWAIAFKFEPRQEITRVADIILQVGRTGILTPVTLLDPVSGGGVTISRATLHNYDEMVRKDVRPGDMVRVARAGDVIPDVVERVDDRADSLREPALEMPEGCPICQNSVIRDGAYYRCTGGLSCRAQLLGSIIHFASKGGMDIDGLGAKSVNMFLKQKIINDSAADLYAIRRKDLLDLERFAEKSADNLLAAIEDSKSCTLHRFIYALGIPLVGEHVARVLTDSFGGLSPLMEAEVEELESIHEIGSEVADSVRSFFDSASNRTIIQRLLAAGVKPELEEREEGEFSGLRFVFTGSLERFKRGEIKRLMENQGAVVSSTVSGNTDFLVAGEESGSKLEQAKKKGVKTLSQEEFYDLLEEKGIS